MTTKIICNGCGRELCQGPGAFRREYLHVTKEWGYFSKKDGTRQEWNLCEDCYDRLLEQFRIPAAAAEMTELV